MPSTWESTTNSSNMANNNDPPIDQFILSFQLFLLQSIRAFLSPRGQVLFPLRISIKKNNQIQFWFSTWIFYYYYCVHKVDWSSYKDDDNIKVQNGRIQNKSTKWTGHHTRMMIWSPKWTDTKQVHKVDGSSHEDDSLKSKMDGSKQVHKVNGSSHEDDDLKSKMDGYKTCPQSGRIIPRG